MASDTVMPWSTTLTMASSVMVMMREPPGLPITMASRPSLVRMVGLIDEIGVLPGATALASLPSSPNWFDAPDLAAKSSISSFISTPVSPATRRRPNHEFSV